MHHCPVLHGVDYHCHEDKTSGFDVSGSIWSHYLEGLFLPQLQTTGVFGYSVNDSRLSIDQLYFRIE